MYFEELGVSSSEAIISRKVPGGAIFGRSSGKASRLERGLRKLLFSKEFSVWAVICAGPYPSFKIAIDVLDLPVFVIGGRLAFQLVVFEIHPSLYRSAGIILEYGAFEEIVLIHPLVLETAIFEIAEAGAVALAVVVDPLGHQFTRRVV